MKIILYADSNIFKHILLMHKSFMAWLKSVTELCLKTYLSTLTQMLKNFMAWLFTAYMQMRKVL